MKTLRLFAAIFPAQETILQLTRLQKGVSGARWVAPEKMHLTLGFFGDVTLEQAELLDDALGQIDYSSFDVSIKGTGHFGRAQPHALWAGVERSDALSYLHRACRKAARKSGLAMETRNYRPHITLAYLKSSAHISRIVAFERGHAGFAPPPFLSDQFYLVSSLERGGKPRLYRKEAAYPLLARQSTPGKTGKLNGT